MGGGGRVGGREGGRERERREGNVLFCEFVAWMGECSQRILLSVGWLQKQQIEFDEHALAGQYVGAS